MILKKFKSDKSLDYNIETYNSLIALADIFSNGIKNTDTSSLAIGASSFLEYPVFKKSGKLKR